jgi:F-type H+-transporting ATPase subunit c
MKNVSRFALFVASVLASAPAFAEEMSGAAQGGWGGELRAIGTSGQARAAASAYEGIGRNPQSAEKLFTPLILGLALIEFQVIMAFIISILLVNK